MSEILRYLKKRNLSGGEALLASHMMQEGKTAIQTDFSLLSYNSDRVACYLYSVAVGYAGLFQYLNDCLESDLLRGDMIPDDIITGSRAGGQKAKYIKKGLANVFPNIDDQIRNW